MMSFDILIQEANGLSEDKIAEVISFIQFLKTKDISKSDNTPGQYRILYHISMLKLYISNTI